MPAFTRLPLITQTACARLLDALLTSVAGDFAAGATLVSKRIKARRYWYVQRTTNGKKVQTYLGPETPELLERIEHWKSARAEAANRSELVAILRAGGAFTISAAEARVLADLAPVFRRGGVLVGSHAFAVLGNMLGVRWQDAIVRTEDVDLAHDPRIEVAVDAGAEPIVLREMLGDATPRFSVLDPASPATSFTVRGTEIQVDLLTPMIGRERVKPVKIAALGAAATPLRFLDYLIEETQPGAVVGGEGVLVNVPRPGRFALHKLIVASRRSSARSSQIKAGKDLAQASALLELLLEDLPGELTLAWKALSRRGKAWSRAVQSSAARLEPLLVARLSDVGVVTRESRR